ncbi:MAG TPA: hypothetical protein VH879_13005 [Gemmatimonadales bacterium]|jgi:hypothetical protein
MGKINWGSVIVGGLVAGVVLNVIDFVLYGVVLRTDMDAAMQAVGKAPLSNAMIYWFVVLDFLFGIFFVWMYAAIRPRFGPGPRTAVTAGLALWVLFGLLHALSEAPMGLLPQKLYVIGTLVALVEYPLAVVIGARWYREAA